MLIKRRVVYVWRRWELSGLPAQFCCEPKTTLQIKFINKKVKHSKLFIYLSWGTLNIYIFNMMNIDKM